MSHFVHEDTFVQSLNKILQALRKLTDDVVDSDLDKKYNNMLSDRLVYCERILQKIPKHMNKSIRAERLVHEKVLVYSDSGSPVQKGDKVMYDGLSYEIKGINPFTNKILIVHDYLSGYFDPALFNMVWK